MLIDLTIEHLFAIGGAIVAILIAVRHLPRTATPQARSHSDLKATLMVESFDPNATRIISRPIAEAKRTGRDGATVQARDLQLVGVSGSCRGSSFRVSAAGLMIGRHDTCDIQVTDPRVSSQHAWIGLVGKEIILRDLGSTNGTFLNTNMDTPIRESGLHPGDTIVLGGHMGDQFRLRVTD